MSSPSSSSSSKSATEAAKAAYEATLQRLNAIQSHLTTRTRSGRLAGKVCIVTGAGSKTGIGRASVLHFAHEGAKHIYALDLQSDNLEELKATVEKTYTDVKITVLECDASDEESISNIVQRALDEQGQLDVFFANAAITGGIGPIWTMDSDELAETLKINVTSCFLAVKYASQAMKKTSSSKQHSNGSIILTASVAGLRSGAGPSGYSASKAAVINLAQTSSWQLMKTGIRVNAVCPGLIQTGMTEVVFEMAKVKGTEGKIGQLNPTGRYGVAEEIANAIVFLASDEASYVNGIAMPIDGGLSASHPVMPGKMS